MSHHPISQKMSAYNSFIHRLLSIPLSPEDYHNEVDTIKYIAVSNGYRSDMIDKLIRKNKSRNNRPPEINSECKQKYAALEYGTALNNVIKNEMAKNNIKVSFRTSNKLSKFLKDKGQNKKQTGIYQLKCNDCPSIYIGQTARSFSILDLESIYPNNQNQSPTLHLPTI